MPDWSRAKIERTIRRLIAWVTVWIAAVFLAGRVGILGLSKESLSTILSTFLALGCVNFLLEVRARRLSEADPVAIEPSQAFTLAMLIVMTGAAGVIALVKSGPEAGSSLPYIVAVGTILLAILAFKLASKHKDKIGEARFKAPPERP